MSKKRKITALLSSLRIPLLIAIAAVMFFTAISHVQVNHRKEEQRLLEDALRKTAVACYANEGKYPPSVEYMEKHYGVQINRDRYAVFYEVFAENLMPEITVVELK